MYIIPLQHNISIFVKHLWATSLSGGHEPIYISSAKNYILWICRGDSSTPALIRLHCTGSGVSLRDFFSPSFN